MKRKVNFAFTVLVLAIILGDSSSCYSQESYFCQNTIIGKLVTKNLIKNDTVYYSLLNKEQDTSDFVDMQKVNSPDDDPLVIITRVRKAKDGGKVELQFTYNKFSEKCGYLILVISNSNDMNKFYQIDENGQLANMELYDKVIVKKRQGEIKRILNKFR